MEILLSVVSDIMGPTEYDFIHTDISQVLEASILLRAFNAWGECMIDWMKSLVKFW